MRVKHAFLALCAIAALVGCGGSTTEDSGGEATMRALSVITSPASVDVFTDFELVAVGLVTGEMGGYGSINAGLVGVGVRQTGGTQTIASTDFTAGTGLRYTIVAYPNASNAPAVMAVEDDFTAPVAGKFKMRLFHVDRLIGNVDVYITAPGDSLSASTPVLTNVPFTGATSYVAHSAASQVSIRITTTGTTTQVGPEVLVTPADGSIKTLTLFNSGGPSINLYADLN